MIVKICGLTETEHAVKAAEAGADLLGFVFAASRRRVSPETARQIINQLPASVSKVGVFVNEDCQLVNEIASYCGLNYVQLHGRETPAECKMISLPVIKGFRIKDENSLEQLAPYQDSVEIFLLDTFVEGVPGGSGITFDWDLARQAASYGKVMLAGGLNPFNVTMAIAEARPYGVDVSSGVETAGVKDPVKIQAFIDRVKGRENDVCIT